MLENARRQLVVVALSIVAALLFLGTLGIRQGLDLKGGTQLIYDIDIASAKEQGLIERSASTAEISQLVDETVRIISERIDPDGKFDALVTRRGESGILVELPQRDEAEARAIESRIQTLGRLEFRMVAKSNYNVVEDEGTPDERTIRLELASEKAELESWLNEGDNLQQVLEEPTRIRNFNNLRQIERTGTLNIQWFPHLVKPERRRGSKQLVWNAYSRGEAAAQLPAAAVPAFDLSEVALDNPPESPDVEPKIEFIAVNMHAEHFSGEDLNPSSVRGTLDEAGKPALSYEMKSSRQGDYYDWSLQYKGDHSAIILNGYIESAPYFVNGISGVGQISGNFTPESVQELQKTLRTGSLKLRPVQISKSVIGATLGQRSIDLALISISIGALLVLGFILFYYRLSGIVAFSALMLNVLLIMGLIAATRSTLTLPGLAGLVLTMGMAIDANILIYERIREELARGKEILQACRTGFDRAIVTIIDANVTTFIAGIVLYNVGSGPVSGFAVTLMIGIVTTLFTAFFVSRVVFHYLLEAGKLDSFHAASWLKNVKFDFLGQAKKAVALSVVLVIGGLVVFAMVPRAQKYAIDFTGGANLTIALREPTAVKDVREKLQNSDFAQVYGDPIVNTIDADQDNRATSFAVRVKLTDDQRELIDEARRTGGPEFEPDYLIKLRDSLEGDLVSKPFGEPVVTEIPGDSNAFAAVPINFQKPVRAGDIKRALAPDLTDQLQVVDPANGEVAADDAQLTSVSLQFPVLKGTDNVAVLTMINDGLENDRQRDGDDLSAVDGTPVKLSDPIPESSTIGGRIVGDLRNSAISALAISLFVIVLFIRVRFHEYKYGIAAVVALVHDVLVTLGLVTLANYLGLVDAEINLAMIAAFLTIIGYSINDTIVIFDRVRENLQEGVRLGEKIDRAELLNRSISQTLSRTILTTLTTMAVVVTQFVVNSGAGSSLEGFSFALMIGLLSGTYSTIFIASPVMLWLWRRDLGDGAAPAKPSSDTKDDPALATSGA
ncbi:MAG: protein translocase subunit SecD [Planctomycetota bacterium]